MISDGLPVRLRVQRGGLQGALTPLRRGLCTLVLLFCALACTTAARAQEPSEGEYKELIDQALLEFKHKNWPEARVLFRRAHDLSPSARTLRGMGVVSYEMRDYVQAVRDLSAALADPRQPLTESQRTECQTLLSRSRTFVGVFDVQVTPAEAELYVDGGRVTREPDGTLLLAFGSHTLRAAAEGHQDETVRVNVQGGERGSVELALDELGAAPLATEQHAEEQVEPTPEPATKRPPTASKREGGLRYTWVALGASAAFGAGAVAAWMLGDKELDNLDASCKQRATSGTPCTRGAVSTSTIKSYERVSNAAIGLSAAALVTAGVLAYFEWPRERAVSVGLGPSSLSVRGEF
jgi:hypothetical protein